MNKITQTQARILTAMLEAKAEKAVELAAEQAKENAKANSAMRRKAIDKVWAKHKAKMTATLTPSYSYGYRGAGVPEFGEKELEAFLKDVQDEIAGLKLKGDEDRAYVAFPALGMTNEWGRRGKKLQVPASQLAKWEALAKRVDKCFLQGDARALADLIEGI